MARHLPTAALAALLAAGCATTPHIPLPATPSLSTPASCHATGTTPTDIRPDPQCTPGVINPDVTQTNIWTTICRPGWTATIRPPASYTNTLKARQLVAYQLPGPPSAYEEDHRVPLEVGGAPSDPRNLWPELGPTPNPKDRIENTVHRQICAGRTTLAAGQAVFLGDWWASTA